MLELLQSNIDNTRDIYYKLAREERKDIVAEIVLSRVKEEILLLENRHDKKSRQKVTQSGIADRIIRYVCEALYRSKHHAHRRHYTLPQVSASTILQAQAGTR